MGMNMGNSVPKHSEIHSTRPKLAFQKATDGRDDLKERIALGIRNIFKFVIMLVEPNNQSTRESCIRVKPYSDLIIDEHWVPEFKTAFFARIHKAILSLQRRQR